MVLTESHFDALRQLAELPTKMRVRTYGVPQELIDLTAAGFAEIVPIGVVAVLPEITDDGRKALATAGRSNQQRPH